jgi:putative DNA primase/helicase
VRRHQSRNHSRKPVEDQRPWDGIAAYAAKAKNFEIRSTAEEIKARGERTLGQMLLQRGEIVGFNEGTRSKTGSPSAVVPTNSHLTPFPSAGSAISSSRNRAHSFGRRQAMSAAFDALIAKAHAVPIEREIARRRINLRGRVDRCGPCPRCGGRDRFSINTVKGVFNCRGCGVGGDIIALVQHLDGCDFQTAVRKLAGEHPPTPAAMPTSQTTLAASRETEVDHYEREQHRKAAWLWSRRRPVRATIAETYLRRARGITCALPLTLGFLPAYKQHAPALIAAFAIPAEPEPGILAAPSNIGAVHLIALKPDGSGKADIEKPKTTVGRPGGLPIVAAPPNDLLTIAITEGIEDALSLHQALGVGGWAAGSASFMPKLAQHVSDYIETVVIELHPDGGRCQGLELKSRLRARNIEVFVREAAV